MNPYGFDNFGGGYSFSNDPMAASMRNMMSMQGGMNQYPQFPQHSNQLSLQAHPMHTGFMQQPMISPFGLFGGFGGMHHNMQQQMSNMMQSSSHQIHGSSPMSAGTSFQSFSSVSYGSGGNQPHVYETSSSTQIGPNGVKETRKTEKDSRSGVQKIQVGHHIGERAHIVEKSNNLRTGDQEESQEYLNIDEDEAPAFNNEFMHRVNPAMQPQQQQQQRQQASITYTPGTNRR